jgi:hypothetical protein
MAIARQLKVSPSTVSRDIKALKRKMRSCPHCGQFPRPAPDERDDSGVVEKILADLQAEGRWAARGLLPRSGSG